MKKFILNVLLLSSIILTISACKKISDEETAVNFHLFNPVTNEGFKDVTVKIYKLKVRDFQEDEIELIWEGKTNENGYAHCRYQAWEFYKYQYFPEIDQDGEYPLDQKLIQFPSKYVSIFNNKVNKLDYKFAGQIQWIHHFKNINCFDENDRVRWRYKDITTSEGGMFSNWYPSTTGASLSPSGYFEGCEEVLTATRVDEQTIFYSQLEVTKNDSTYYVEDTMYLTGENGVDTLRLYY